MIDVELKPGDVFATSNPQALGWMINFVQEACSADSSAEYSHAGIITSPEGETFEALWKIGPGNLKAYEGKQIIIARWNKMDESAYKNGMIDILPQSGGWYPFGRLLLHLFRISKIHIKNREVCSELTTHFLVKAGACMTSGQNWHGVTPDYLVDEWRISRHFNIIFEGTA